MINQLRLTCLNSFPKVIHEIKKLEPNHYSILFDFCQKKKYGETTQSYVGEKLCGEACYVFKNILEDEGYNLRVMYNSRRCGKEIEDHCFLVINQKIIVDPTYRQFLKYNILDEPKSLQYLYHGLDPFFIGTEGMLFDIINGSHISDTTIKKYWEREHDITYKFK